MLFERLQGCNIASVKRISLMTAAVLAAVFLFALFPLPERTRHLPVAANQSHGAIGAIHIHTNRSDGSGSLDDVAAAAANAGLTFIIITDHGDGTRAPEPPQYRSGVLVIDAVELSSSNGHYIAIGLPQSPYPLRGEARDVVEDVKRLGGFGIVAHPHSAKANLQWHDWDAPFDAMEWLNADSEWRDESTVSLARALLRYPLRPSETLASLLDRPDETLAKWDELLQRRRVVGVAGADAHARIGSTEEDGSSDRGNRDLNMPSYEASFRTFTTHVETEGPLSRDPRAAAAQIISGLKAGRSYSSINALLTPATISFTHTFDQAAGETAFVARTNATSEGTIVLRKDNRVVGRHPLPELKFRSKEQGTYRIEVYLSNSPGDPPVPWIVTNPIYIHPESWGAPVPTPFPAATDARSIQGGPWHVEKDEASAAGVVQKDPPGGTVEFTYTLAAGARSGQYAALGISVGTALVDRSYVRFRAHASQPTRISVQARRPRSGERWQRSVYLDATFREVVVALSDMRPVDAGGRFDPRLVDTVLFVVDTVNTMPGTGGSLWIGDLQVER
jgi:hypothetical protein